VTAIHGADAVAIVRAGGFIAAIEPVPSELTEGTVIEQEPVAGVRLEREGVMTLRLATPMLDAAQIAMEEEGGLACEQATRAIDPDDTEEWFEQLALSRRDTPARATSDRRHRKHRRSKTPARQRMFDPPPAPSIGTSDPGRRVTLLQRPRERASFWPLLASSLSTLAPSLAGLQLRRASALLAGVLLFVLLGVRLFASGDRRAQVTHPRALTRSTGANLPVRMPASAGRPPLRRRLRRSHSPRPAYSRARSAQHDAPGRKEKAAPVASPAARSANQPQAIAAPATAARPSPGGQFSYLGQ